MFSHFSVSGKSDLSIVLSDVALKSFTGLISFLISDAFHLLLIFSLCLIINFVCVIDMMVMIYYSGITDLHYDLPMYNVNCVQ